MRTISKKPHAAFLILAHNEAGVITRSVSSAASCLAQGDVIIVVADNCTDDTAGIASRAGAQVLIRKSMNAGGKAEALSWFIERHFELISDHSMIIVLDADSRVEANFMEIIRKKAVGSDCSYQCFVFPESQPKSYIGKLAALSELLDQLISDRIRTSLHWPVRLRGTGMVIRPQHLHMVARHLQSEVEDIALSLLFSSEGIRIERIDDALVFDPKPQTTRDAANQRARWFRGQWTAAWQYRKQIIKMAARGPAHWSLLSSLFLKPKWLFLLAGLMLAILLSHWPWLSIPFWLLAALGVLYLICGLIALPDRKDYLRALVFLPAFVWMWIRGIISSMQSSSWRRARE